MMETTGPGFSAPELTEKKSTGTAPNGFERLPENAMLKIFSELDTKSVASFASTQKHVHKVHRKFSVGTNWGRFWITEASYYEGIKYEERQKQKGFSLAKIHPIQLKKKIGVSVKIEFVPGPKVRASKIGLVQTAQAYIKGVPRLLDDYKEKMMVQANKDLSQGHGTHIDVLKEHVDPMYAAAKPKQPKKADEVGSGEADPFYGTWGTEKTRASLIDEPLDQTVLGQATIKLEANPRNEPNSGQVFETTALALAGEQKGTYYGSVRWGWRTDGDGNFAVLPLTVISSGSISETFKQAALRWNQGHNTKAFSNRQLPIPK